MSNLFLNRHLDLLDARRAVATRVRTGHTADEEQRQAADDELLWCAAGEPVPQPISSPQADVAFYAMRAQVALHARRGAEATAFRASAPVPPHKLIEAATAETPLEQFECFQVGGRPADDMPLSARIDRISGIVLTHGACVLLGMLIVVAVL